MARTKMPVNSEVIKWARETINLEIEEAAKKISVSQERLISWERGEDRPTYTQLKKLSNLYKRPSSLFFYAFTPEDLKLPKDFRVLKESDIRKLNYKTIIEIRDAQRKRNDVLYLSNLIGKELKQFPYSATLNTEIKPLAQKFRDLFGLTYEDQKKYKDDNSAFNFWRRAIEKLGVLVFQSSFKSVDELRGLTIFYPTFPLILLNTKDSLKPRIFSLLHEFCHVLLHKSGIGNMTPNLGEQGVYNEVEVFCNAFAAECMVPNDLLCSETIVRKINRESGISNNDLKTLSNRYNASWEVILRRLLDLDKITQVFYENYRDNANNVPLKPIEKSKGGPPYHVLKSSYNGEPFTELALNCFSYGKITEVELSRCLGMKLNSIEKFAPFVGSHRKKGTANEK